MFGAISRIIVRHRSYGSKEVRNLSYWKLGALLFLGLFVFSYTRVHTPLRVEAATADTINFQARLYNSSGNKVTDGNYSIAFTLYDAISNGNTLWSETQASVSVKNGYFSVPLGSVTAFSGSIDWSQDKWLTMNVNSDGEMNPRIKLTATPYAFQAGQADSLTTSGGTVSGDSLVQLSPSSSQAVNSALAALRINQTGTGLLAQLQGNGSDVFTVSKTGAITSAALNCSANANGGALTANASGQIVCSDDDGGTVSTTTLNDAYASDADGADTVIDLTGADDSLIIRNPSNLGTDSGYVFGIEQLSTGAVDGLRINSAGSGSLAVFDTTSASGDGLSVDVASSSSTQFVFSATSGNGSIQGLYVRADGRVGIGTSSPQESLDVAGGIKFGNTSNANAGTLRWTGSDFEGYDGTQWVSLTSGGASAGNLSVNSFYAYDAVGGVSVNAGWTDLNLDTEVREDLDYTHATDGATVTINSDGWYEITYNVSVYTLDGGNNQGSAEARIVEDTGGGFGAVAGSLGYMALKSGGTDSNAAVTIVRQYTAGDVVKLQAQRSSGTLNTTTRAGSVGLTIKRYGESAGGGSGPSNAFVQNGNSFGANAILGTTDSFGIDIITNGSTALGFASTGEATFSKGVTVNQGGLSIVGNSSISGQLSGLTGLTVSSGGASIAGGLDLNNSGISNSGSITGVGSNITGSGGLTVGSGGVGSLTLASGSGIINISSSTLRRSASGNTNIELNDTSDTTLNITNTDGSAQANLNVEGLVTAASFSGNGSGLTDLNASNLASGSISDSLLSSNVALLDTTQSFTTINTFSAGLTLGNTASTTAGTLRFTGTDFEGYDGSTWVSLTSGGGGGGGSGSPLLEGVLALGKVAANGTAINVDGATVSKTATGTYTVTLNSAASNANYTVQLSMEESNATREDLHISLDNQTTTSFRVTIREGDSGGSTNVLTDKIWHFIAFDPNAAAGGGGTPSNAFTQGGNSFGGTALLGTTDSFGLNIISGGSTALSIASTGEATFSNSLTINSGGLSVSGNSSINGTLSGLTGLTVVSGGASFSGGVNINSSGITNAGSISGATTINASGAISAATTTNTINGLVINSGNLSGVTGFSQSSGSFTMSGGGTFSTGTGAVTLNGATTISGGKTLNVSGLTTLGALNQNGATNINTSGGSATNIGTGTSTGAISFGSGSNSFSLNSTAFDVSSAGALSGVTTISASGAISAATSSNTINGLVINGGGLSSVTGITFASGSLNLNSGGITNAGSLAGVTSITASGNVSTTGVYQQNGSSGVTSLNCLSGQYIGAASVRGGIVTAGACEADQKSDVRLKENIVELDSVLDNLKNLNVVKYDYRCDEAQFLEMRLSCEAKLV